MITTLGLILPSSFLSVKYFTQFQVKIGYTAHEGRVFTRTVETVKDL